MFDDITSVFTVLGSILLYVMAGIVLAPRIDRWAFGASADDDPPGLIGFMIMVWPMLVAMALIAVSLRGLGRLSLRQRPRKDPPVPPAHTHKGG